MSANQASGIADQQYEKIDEFIAAEAPAYQAYLMGKDFKQPLLFQVASNDEHFSKSRQH